MQATCPYLIYNFNKNREECLQTGEAYDYPNAPCDFKYDSCEIYCGKKVEQKQRRVEA